MVNVSVHDVQRSPTNVNSKKRAFVHIGIEKTGTTSIQSFMANNREPLRTLGVAYPRTPGHANHIKLTAYALNEDKFDDTRTRYDLTSESQIPGFREQFRDELSRELADFEDCHTVVFSNEHCSARLNEPEEVNRLIDLMSSLFTEVEVIMYLREQGANMVSSYTTNLRNGSSRLPAQDEPNWGKYDYYTRVRRWSDQVGLANVDVRIYDRTGFAGGDLILDFLDAIEQEWVDGMNLPDHKNVSLDARSLEFLRLFNDAAAGTLDDDAARTARSRIVRALESLPRGPRLAFPTDKIALLRETCLESNRKLAQEFLGRDELFPAHEATNGRDEVPHRSLENEEVMELFAQVAASWPT